MMAAETTDAETAKLEKKIHVKRSCNDCGHITVCTVFRAISPLLEKSFTDETRPFGADEIACICRAFVPKALLPS